MAWLTPEPSTVIFSSARIVRNHQNFKDRTDLVRDVQEVTCFCGP